MRKFYLLLMCAVLAMAANAAETTWVFVKPDGIGKDVTSATLKSNNDAAGVWSATAENAFHFNWDSQNDKGVQIGKSKVPAENVKITLSTAMDNVTSIKINAAVGSDGNSDYSFTVGGAAFGSILNITDKNSADYTFEGSGSGEVVLTINASAKAAYVKSITIVTEEVAGTVATPAFSLADGTYDIGTELTITSATEGAQIVYTVTHDQVSGEQQTVASPATVTFDEAGEYSVTAKAVAGDAESPEVSKAYTVVNLTAATLAEFMAIGSENPGIVLTLDCPVTVTVQANNNLFVKDEAGTPMQIFDYNLPRYSQGDVIPAGIQGEYELYNDNTPEITSIVTGSVGEVTEHVEVVPDERTTTTVAASDVNRYVVIRGVTIGAAEANNNYTLTDSEGTLNAYHNPNYFDGEIAPVEGKLYDVTGIVSLYRNNVQLTITGYEEQSEPIDVAEPEFSLEDGGTYPLQTELEITCATEGATLEYSYTVGDGAPTRASGTFPMTLRFGNAGSYRVEATAVLGDQRSETVSCTFTMMDTNVYSLSEFMETGAEHPGLQLTVNTPLIVTCQSGVNLFVRDSERTPLLIFGPGLPSYNVGEVIPEGVVGAYELYDGIPQMVNANAETFLPAEESMEVEGEVRTTATLTADDVNRLVTIKGATVTVNGFTATIRDNEGEIAGAMDYFNGTFVPEETKTYDVTGIASVIAGSAVIYPTSIAESTSGVSAAGVDGAMVTTEPGTVVVTTAEPVEVTVCNAAGQTVATALAGEGTTRLDLGAGFYIVRAGETTVKVVVR